VVEQRPARAQPDRDRDECEDRREREQDRRGDDNVEDAEDEVDRPRFSLTGKRDEVVELGPNLVRLGEGINWRCRSPRDGCLRR
jgi:hypothetical protein